MTDNREPINPNPSNPDERADADFGPLDPRDERLSAELDGAAASDASGEQPMRSDDEQLGERRRELAAARDLLAIPPPPLDDVTRRRLVRNALSEAAPARRSHDRNVLKTVGVAAAVLAVLVVGGVTIKAVSHSSNVNTAASRSHDKAASKETTTAAGNGTQFNELSDPQVLKKRVLRALRDQPQSPSTTAVPQETDQSPQSDTFSRAVPLGECTATVRLPAGVAPTVLGSGTFNGAPATVLVAHDGGRTLIFVVATADCRLLTSQFFGG